MDADKARTLIESAIAAHYENYNAVEVMREAVDGNAKMIMGENSLLVMNLIEHNGETTCHVWLGAGDLEEITGPLKEKAEDWAREQGCKYATIEGRKGWVRALSDYEEVAVTVRKEL